MLDPVVVWTARLVLAAVFVVAAASKLRAHDEFVGVLHNYRLLPEPLERPVAWALPGVEGLVALGLLIEPTRPYAAVGAAALLVVFSLAMAVNLARGRRDIDCGCFASTLRQRLSWGLIGRNGVLLVMALTAVPAELPSRVLGWLDALTALAASATLILVYVAFSRLVGMAPRVRESMTGGTR